MHRHWTLFFFLVASILSCSLLDCICDAKIGDSSNTPLKPRSQSRQSRERQSRERQGPPSRRQKRREDPELYRRLLQELEDSDYSGGSWGSMMKQRRRSKANSKKSGDDFDIDMDSPDSVFLSAGDNMMPIDIDMDSGGLNHLRESSDIDGEMHEMYEILEGNPNLSNYNYNSDNDNHDDNDVEENYWRRQNMARVKAPANAPLRGLFSDPNEWRRLAREDNLAVTHDPNRMLKFVSVLKLTGIVALVSSLCFCSVVPRGLPLAQYNSKYKRMVARVFGAMVWPCTLLALIFRKEDADINKVLNSLVLSFLVGYPAICLFELIACTASRVLILKFTEPEVFKLTPKVPGIILPWTMQSNGYFPSRFTLILFSVVNSCILAPALEEFFKVKFLRLVLPQTEEELKKVNANDRDRVAKKLIAESPVQMPITIRTYLVYMMAICSGLKMADSVRRILLYAKPHQKHKTFFALARGLFPVHEICGALSALDMARRGVLGGAGMDIKSLLPAILLRSAAAFRGLRPFYMWASDRPWDELQLQAWGFEDSATPHQLVLTGAANCLWFLVLASQVHTILTQHVLLTRQFIMKLRDKKLEEEKFMF